MARYCDPTPEQKSGWKEWVATLPPKVQAVAEAFDPWTLYRLKTSGHRVIVYSFGEHMDGSINLTVIVSGRYNRVDFERQVFGIPPCDLEECELPAPDEELGALLTGEKEIQDYIDATRDAVLAGRKKQ